MKWKICPNCDNTRLKKKINENGEEYFDCLNCDSQWTEEFLKSNQGGNEKWKKKHYLIGITKKT